MQYYFTAIYLVVDTRMKRIDYVNAGHPPALFFRNDGSVTTFDSVCCPVGLFDKMDIEPQTIHYEGDGHIALYTDGLLEAVQGGQEEQHEFLIEKLTGSHQWNEAAMQAMFFDDEIPQERDDDKCLVWITLDKGAGDE